MHRPAFATNDWLDEPDERPLGPGSVLPINPNLQYWRLDHLVTIEAPPSELSAAKAKRSTLTADRISLYQRPDPDTAKLWILELKARYTRNGHVRWSLIWFDEDAAKTKWRSDWAGGYRLGLGYIFRSSKSNGIINLGGDEVPRELPIEEIKKILSGLPRIWQNTEAVGGPTIRMLTKEDEQVPG